MNKKIVNLLNKNINNSATEVNHSKMASYSKSPISNKNAFKFTHFSTEDELKTILHSKDNNRYITHFKVTLKKNKLGFFSCVVLIMVFICSILAFLSPYDPNKIVIDDRLLPPSLIHLFGTDELGRDYFTRTIYGGRVSLTVGFLSMTVSIIIGTLVGVISGFLGGKVDKIIMRSIDVLMCIPTFFLILIANAYLKPGIINIIVIIGIFGWMGIARIVRSETLSFREREYILSSRALGASNWQIIRKHIIPNILPTVIVSSTVNIASAILTESSLSFLGLGVQQPTASWGSMLQNAQSYMSDTPHLAVFPGLVILFTVLSFNVLGDILRVSLEPKIIDD